MPIPKEILMGVKRWKRRLKIEVKQVMIRKLSGIRFKHFFCQYWNLKI